MTTSDITSTETERRPGGGIPFLRDERVIRIIAQVVSSAVIIGAVILMIVNFLDAAEARGLPIDYDFLSDSAGFPISETVIDYDPSQSFGRAFLAGIVNTLKVAIVGVIAATLLGTLVGLARLSTNWLLSRLALVYIEFHRNIPLLVLLFIWFFAIFQRLPPVAESISWSGMVYLNQRGLYLTWPRLTEAGGVWIWFVLAGVVLAFVAWGTLRRIRVRTGRATYFGGVSFGILVLLPVIGWLVVGGNALEFDVPTLERFNFEGGLRLTPEYSALFVGLVMYTAAFIAEVVRAGIQAVNRGQLEAARAVGLNGFQVLGLVILPQALRVIIPPLISQYLNLTKNSSLALAIGYPDLFNVGKIMINQAGRAPSVFLMIMASYLVMSIATSGILNLYNRRIQFVER